MLQEIGFEVVGEQGAGGFAELDNESVVFSPVTKAPFKQIIADLARPVAIICIGNDGGGAFNQHS
jgi:NADPH:quinone reductase-like Zn-dependent oxidoreductase